jgi:VWFA-related protein
MTGAIAYYGKRYFQTFLLLLLLCLLIYPAAIAQENPQNPMQQSGPGAPIRLQSNLVVLRVIVRDSKGLPVDGLKEGDFRVFDNKKLQTISHFSVEASTAVNGTNTNPAKKAAEQPSGTSPKIDMPKQFAALFFDDYHLQFADLALMHDAAKRYLAKGLDSGERVAIFKASGQGVVDFTSDADKLQKMLTDLQFNTRFNEAAACPT